MIDDDPMIKKMLKRFNSRGHYHKVGTSLKLNFVKKFKFSKEKIQKFKELIIGYQKQDGLNGQLTDENCVFTEKTFKYCEEKQFETIKIFDRDTEEIKNLSEYSYLMRP